MDATRFDFLTRSLGQRLSRRHLVAAAAALLAGPVAMRNAGATTRSVCRPLGAGCTRNSQCCSATCETRRTAPRAIRNRCICGEGETPCGGVCTSVLTDTTNCGGCGNVCDPETANACVSGTCSCGQWAACADDSSCATDHCNACTDSTAMMCLVRANGDILEGNFTTSYNPDGEPCRSDADCAGSFLTCNPGSTMYCLAAYYWTDVLMESYPVGWCRCVGS